MARGVVVIPKSTNPSRILENFKATTLQLDAEDMEQIASLDAGYRFVDGSFWERDGGPYTVANIWDES